MSRSLFQFEHSIWWIPLILLVAAAASYFLYSKKNRPWSTLQNWVLFGLRTLAIFLLLILLLKPSLKRIINTLQPPKIVVALDNSRSITARGADSVQIKESIARLSTALEDQGFQVSRISFTDADTLRFSAPTTRLSDLLSMAGETTSEDNLAAIVLLSDGIFNRGSSPLYRNYLHPIFTVGMGDTIPPKDISISRTRYNKVTFKGNETPIRLEIQQQGYDNQNSIIRLRENGEVLEEKRLEFRTGLQEIDFLVGSEEEGLRHLVATIPTFEDESTDANNSVDIFLEVINGRQKVLIVAGAPHPDVTAIRRSLEKTDNYTTEVYIPSRNDEVPEEIHDVVIYHSMLSSDVTFRPKQQPGICYILGTENAVSRMNEEISYVSIEQRSSEPDLVAGSFNQDFSKFKIDNTEIFEEYPPIEVPFGDYTVSGATEVLMYQKLGGVITRKPLMVVSDDGTKKSALLVGQNIWRWKLQEAAINDNSNQFDNLITKTIQFLSVKNDKKQFRFDTRSSTFSNSQPVIFDSEVYNEIYERIYGNLIQVTITDENKQSNSYNFTDAERNTTFRAPNLSPGIYQYTATVTIGSETFTEQGEFLVENVNTEYLNLTANHRLLNNLASKTNGKFVDYGSIASLPAMIEGEEFKPIMRSEEDTSELHRSISYFLIIFFLLSAEWVLRRYWGGY